MSKLLSMTLSSSNSKLDSYQVAHFVELYVPYDFCDTKYAQL